MSAPSKINLGKDFRKKNKSLLPVSFRVTPAEKAQLLKDAGPLALSAYIRQELLGDQVAERKKRYVKKQRKPGIDHELLAKLLGTIGRSELGRSLLALSLAAQSGSLPVTDELSKELETACDEIHEMRKDLIVALTVKAERSR
jgi:hypothetical protein